MEKSTSNQSLNHPPTSVPLPPRIPTCHHPAVFCSKHVTAIQVRTKTLARVHTFKKKKKKKKKGGRSRSQGIPFHLAAASQLPTYHLPKLDKSGERRRQQRGEFKRWLESASTNKQSCDRGTCFFFNRYFLNTKIATKRIPARCNVSRRTKRYRGAWLNMHPFAGWPCVAALGPRAGIFCIGSWICSCGLPVLWRLALWLPHQRHLFFVVGWPACSVGTGPRLAVSKEHGN